MSRFLRIALDCTILSITYVKPVVRNLWGMAKSKLASNEKLKSYVQNPKLISLENTLEALTTTLSVKLAEMRCMTLKQELQFLEKEAVKCKERISACQQSGGKASPKKGGDGGGGGGCPKTCGETKKKKKCGAEKKACSPLSDSDPTNLKFASALSDVVTLDAADEVTVVFNPSREMIIGEEVSTIGRIKTKVRTAGILDPGKNM